MGILISSSLIVAFMAGMAALFAPCCITVLLPSYFASIFRQKRKVFFMTFVFFLGILAIFLPLGLGFSALGSLLSQFHDWVYSFGALFLIFLAFSIFFGFHIKMPFYVNPKLAGQNVFSIFILGVFSGLATTCCAPVLAGVLALSVLPGSIFWGTIYVLTYVLGMVIPLFIIALFLDKIKFEKKFSFFQKSFNYKILGKEVFINFSNLIAASMFFIIGVSILVFTLLGSLRMESSFQVTVNIFAAKMVNAISGILKNIPWPVFVILFILIFLVILKIAVKELKENK